VSVLVLDASVAAKWVLPAKGETLVEEARKLLERYVNGEIRFVVPDLFWAETANIFWKASRQGRCTRPDAPGGPRLFGATEFSHRLVALLASAYELATAFDCTVYDSLYVALAIESKANFVTADQRLANALSRDCPVRWLGAAI